MKITIVNEFKYHYKNNENLHSIFFEPDMNLSFNDLQETCELCLSSKIIDNLEKSEFLNLFNESLLELFKENIIQFASNNMVMLSPKGEKAFIEEKMLYSNMAKKLS
jgi:hypothetical protein